MRIGRLSRYLTDDRAKLALASALIQLANFVVLLVAKTAIPDADFAFLLTQLALAGIIGAIASMRFEVLVYQAHGRMTYAAILIPIFASAAVIGATFVAVELINAVGQQSLTLSALSIPMMAGLALSAIQNFAFVQVKRLNALLAARAAQTGALVLVTLAIAWGAWTPTGAEILFVAGLGYAIPSVIWLTLFILQTEPQQDDPSALYLPDLKTFGRAISLTISTGVNSVYVNLPLLVAASTQSASFVADFGLILRAFTAPITLIGQVIGRLFLADALRWSTGTEQSTAALSRMILRAMVQSVGCYLLISPILIGLLYFYRDQLNITHIELAGFLFFAALGQCAVNPVSQVRIPLGDERAFLMLDTTRLFALALGLYGLMTIVPFELAFTSMAMVLYLSYIAFILLRVSRYKAL